MVWQDIDEFSEKVNYSSSTSDLGDILKSRKMIIYSKKSKRLIQTVTLFSVQEDHLLKYFLTMKYARKI